MHARQQGAAPTCNWAPMGCWRPWLLLAAIAHNLWSKDTGGAKRGGQPGRAAGRHQRRMPTRPTHGGPRLVYAGHPGLEYTRIRQDEQDLLQPQAQLVPLLSVRNTRTPFPHEGRSARHSVEANAPCQWVDPFSVRCSDVPFMNGCSHGKTSCLTWFLALLHWPADLARCPACGGRHTGTPLQARGRHLLGGVGQLPVAAQRGLPRVLLASAQRRQLVHARQHRGLLLRRVGHACACAREPGSVRCAQMRGTGACCQPRSMLALRGVRGSAR